jgi:hypothetical protein
LSCRLRRFLLREAQGKFDALSYVWAQKCLNLKSKSTAKFSKSDRISLDSCTPFVLMQNQFMFGPTLSASIREASRRKFTRYNR